MSAGGCVITFSVPANKLLVIETISVFAKVQPGQKPFAVINPQQGQFIARFYLPLQPQATLGGFDRYNGVHLVRLYADPQAAVQVAFDRDIEAGTALAEAAISGYLVDCGAGAGPCPVP